MSIDGSGAAQALAVPSEVQAGYGAGLGATQFNQAMQAAEAAAGGSAPGGAQAAGGTDALQPALKGMMQTLEHVNGEATQLGQMADAAKAKGASLQPGEMVMMTVRCQEFMFHCQLTSNIANRTSDGLQQLFRQQG